VLVVTHHVGFAQHLLKDSKRPTFAFLEAGRIVESGGPETLVRPISVELRAFLETTKSLA
jgi:ABC-type histidine transport system ATPase subunit